MSYNLWLYIYGLLDKKCLFVFCLNIIKPKNKNWIYFSLPLLKLGCCIRFHLSSWEQFPQVQKNTCCSCHKCSVHLTFCEPHRKHKPVLFFFFKLLISLHHLMELKREIHVWSPAWMATIAIFINTMEEWA